MSTMALDLVNAVLARLRESQVASGSFATDTYAQLILRLANETKTEVEDAFDWTALRTAKVVTTAAATSTYTITGVGQRFRFYDRRKIIWNATNRTQIIPYPQAMFDELLFTATVNNQIPNWYKLTGADANGDPTLTLYPTPDGIYTLEIPLVVPQADLSAFGDTFAVPRLPVELGTWARAISERGEDGSTSASLQWQAYQMCLGDHIAIESGRVEDEVIWVTV
jgi:hypothetical protein